MRRSLPARALVRGLCAAAVAGVVVGAGAAVPAAAETVDVGLTFRNKGPGWVANLRSGEPVGAIDFVVPQGATVTGAPGNCSGLTLGGDWYEGPPAPRATGASCPSGSPRSRR